MTNLNLKSIVTAALILFSFSACNHSSEKRSNDLQEAKLKGEVKSVRADIYDAVENSEKIEIGERMKSWSHHLDDGNSIIIEYNKFGNIIEKAIYDTNDTLISKLTCTYDEKGNKIEESTNNHDGSLKSRTTYTYDEKGNVVNKTLNSHSEYETSMITDSKHDEKANMIEINMYSLDSLFVGVICYTYDENENMIEKNGSYPYDSLLQRGSVGDSLRIKRTFEYDENGNMIALNHHRDNGEILYTQVTRKYDENSNQIEHNEYSYDGTLAYNVTFEYDEYDEMGNWCKQTTFHHRDGEKEADEITIRKIEYY